MIKTTIVILFLFLSGMASGADLSLNEIVQRHTEAMGGAAALEKVNSIEFHLIIEEPQFKVNAVYVADRNRHMRIDIYSEGKRVFTEAYDGTRGWQQGAEGPAKESSAAGSAALLHGIIMPGKMFGLHEMAANGHQLRLEGRETVDEIDYYVLQLTLDDGFVTHYYIHPETFRIERSRDTRAFHPDMDPTAKWLESRFLDFRNVDGTMRAFRTEQYDLKSGKQIGTTTVEEIRLNPKLDPAQFMMPSS